MNTPSFSLRHRTLLIALLCAQGLQAGITVGRLRTEAILNPIGIDTQTPAFR